MKTQSDISALTRFDMDLKLRDKNECLFDEVSLGEVMLRLDPGEGRIRTARSFNVCEGGGEYNVARALRKCFGMKTAVVTAIADNEVGALTEDLIMQGGVDTSFINKVEFDGIGRNVRNGLNFTERGFGIRGAVGMYDRGYTAASQMKTGDVDWDHIFGELGVRWFHTGGIFTALSKSTAELTVQAVKKAKEYGVAVSYDFNFRPSLWKNVGDKAEVYRINREIAECVDVFIGGKFDFEQCLGIDFGDKSEYGEICERVMAEYPNVSLMASTARQVKSASVNSWKAVCYSDGKLYSSIEYPSLEIFDRVGGGDGFASGLIYGLMNSYSPETSLNYGVVHGALVMTTPGDTSSASLKEIESQLSGCGSAVQR